MNNANNINSRNNNGVAQRTNQIIYVECDFDGNLEEAIAAADDGDVVKLGNNTYTTSGITIDKDITIDGILGKSIIDGEGTTNAIISISPEASGATLRDLSITDGNIGIYADGATNLTLRNLEVHHIGIDEPIRDGQNNVGISLFHADGVRVLNSHIHDIGRKGVGINDTDGGLVSGLTLEDINLDAEHAQSFDAAGIKLFNTNDFRVLNNELSSINAFNIWNDITSGTVIRDNLITDIGDRFLPPDFTNQVDVAGIYNEKSYESVVDNNTVTSVDEFTAFRATAFTTETMRLGENDFSTVQLNTEDFWANEAAERLVAITEDPDEANFELFADDFFIDADIGI